MRNRNVLKWSVYAVVMLLLAVLQATPHFLPRILGVSPLYVFPFAIAVAMYEGETAGASFAILGGLLWDFQVGRTFGFNALFLMVFCITVALLMRHLFRNTIFSALLFCLCAMTVHECVTWFFFVYLRGDAKFLYTLTHGILPIVLYTTAFMLPFYFLVRFINRRLTEAD